MKKLVFGLVILYAISANAQYPAVQINGSHIRKITSKIVEGQEYTLHIMLPSGYEKSTKKYPLVFLMDSQWDYPLVTSIYGEQYYDGFIPELILVGVTWGGNKPNPDSLRVRDYTPTLVNGQIQSGRADKFLGFMKNELFPFLENNYKVDPENRTLMGCSLGGLFTLYSLFTHADMFSGYVAASPAIAWDKDVIAYFEKSFSDVKLQKAKRVYMTVGEVELGKEPFESFAKTMDSRQYYKVSLASKVLINTGHSGTKSETYTRGLQYIFERKKLELSESQLANIAGTYVSDQGKKITVFTKNKQTFASISPDLTVPIFANSSDHFYATFSFFNLYFTSDKLELAQYGNSTFFKKL